MEISQSIKVAVDAVVFSFKREVGVRVLLIKRKNEPFIHRWVLPGGFVENDESLERAVRRELLEETHLKINYLEQFFTFGRPERDPRGRVISVAYFGLVKPGRTSVQGDDDAEDADWFALDDLPDLAFDHLRIVETAIAKLRDKMRRQPLGFEMLPNKFPFSDLEKVYNSLWHKPFDRRNFKKKIMSLGLLETQPEQITKGRGRPAHLFKFNKTKYFELKESGWQFEV